MEKFYAKCNLKKKGKEKFENMLKINIRLNLDSALNTR